jgi:hypothetical protein
LNSLFDFVFSIENTQNANAPKMASTFAVISVVVVISVEILDKHLIFHNLNKNHSLSQVNYDSALSYYVVHLCMLLEPQSQLRDYWKDPTTSLFVGNRIIPRIITRDQWVEINKRVSPTEQCKDILDKIAENVRENYTSTNYVSIDEWVPFYKGQNPWGVWMSCKPAGQGFKIYVAADSNAVPLYFRLYQGKGQGNSMYDVVLEAEGKLERDQMVIVVDSYFGSEKLAQELNRRGRHFIMSIRSNSTLNKHFQACARQDIAKGEWLENVFPAKFRESERGGLVNEQLLSVFFRDRKDIFLLTNFCVPSKEQQKFRLVPSVVHYYNQFMGGVDNFDAGNWGKNHKIQNYSRCLSYWAFRATVNVAWRYWNLQEKEIISQRAFIQLLILDFLKKKNIDISSSHKLVSKKKAMKCAHCKGNSTTTLVCAGCQVPVHWRCVELYHASLLTKK